MIRIWHRPAALFETETDMMSHVVSCKMHLSPSIALSLTGTQWEALEERLLAAMDEALQPELALEPVVPKPQGVP